MVRWSESRAEIATEAEMCLQPVSHPAVAGFVQLFQAGQFQARRVSFCPEVVMKQATNVVVPVLAMYRMDDSELAKTVRQHARILTGLAPPDSSEHWAEWQGDDLERNRKLSQKRQRRYRERRRQRENAGKP